MARVLNSFKIRSKGRILDYRLGEDLDIEKVKCFFQQNYHVQKLWKGPRHILGLLIKDQKEFFLKLSTSKGISVITKNEFNWNNYFNEYSSNTGFRVPKNYDSGLYEEKYFYFYLITEYFAGTLLQKMRAPSKNLGSLRKFVPQIIEFSEIIQKLPIINFAVPPYQKGNYQARFISKIHAWLKDIPSDICKNYQIIKLLEITEKSVEKLSAKPRHGDFTPWHMIKLANGKIGLIDGEHAQSEGVENYDICYFIQRVFSVLENPSLAKSIFDSLLRKGYSQNKLRTVLAARVIGGFLDESLTSNPNYTFANSFKEWVLEG